MRLMINAIQMRTINLARVVLTVSLTPFPFPFVPLDPPAAFNEPMLNMDERQTTELYILPYPNYLAPLTRIFSSGSFATGPCRRVQWAHA